KKSGRFLLRYRPDKVIYAIIVTESGMNLLVSRRDLDNGAVVVVVARIDGSSRSPNIIGRIRFEVFKHISLLLVFDPLIFQRFRVDQLPLGEKVNVQRISGANNGSQTCNLLIRIAGSSVYRERHGS